ncbi:MAG: kelch repeat-containing protein, partial [Ekhidna sp.]
GSKTAIVEVSRLSRTKIAATSLIMKDPIISKISKTEFEVGEIITLTGENFHPIASNNQLQLGDVPLLINSSEKASVTFSSPLSIVSNTLISEEFKGILKYSNSIGSTNSNNVQITYEGPWTKLSPPSLLEDDHYGMVTTNSENFIYLFGGHKYENQSFTFSNTLQQYNISTDEWSQISSFPANGRDHAQIFEYKNSLYIGSGQSLDYFYDFWKYDITFETWTQLNDIPNYTGNTRPQTLVNNNRIFSLFDRKIFEYSETTDTWNQLALDLPYQYYWIIGIYPESSSIKMPIIEIFNANVAQSTLHDITFNPDTESIIINQSYSPFGYSQSFLRGDADKLFLVSANQYLYTLQNGTKLQVQKPNTNKIYYAEEINGILYLGFNDGSFWSYNYSK